jgi:hypothetical protein
VFHHIANTQWRMPRGCGARFRRQPAGRLCFRGRGRGSPIAPSGRLFIRAARLLRDASVPSLSLHLLCTAPSLTTPQLTTHTHAHLRAAPIPTTIGTPTSTTASPTAPRTVECPKSPLPSPRPSPPSGCSRCWASPAPDPWSPPPVADASTESSGGAEFRVFFLASSGSATHSS